MTGQANPERWPEGVVVFFDSNGKVIDPVYPDRLPDGDQAPGLLQTGAKSFSVREGAAKMEIHLGSETCNGVFDFKHAEVMFKDR